MEVIKEFNKKFIETKHVTVIDIFSPEISDDLNFTKYLRNLISMYKMDKELVVLNNAVNNFIIFPGKRSNPLEGLMYIGIIDSIKMNETCTNAVILSTLFGYDCNSEEQMISVLKLVIEHEETIREIGFKVEKLFEVLGSEDDPLFIYIENSE
jgi:hypothetical protein